MIEIVTADDPRIEAYFNLKKPKPGLNTFIAENEKVVQRLLNSNTTVKSILGLPTALDRNFELIQKKGIQQDKIFTASKSILEEITGFSIHRGLLAEGEIPKLNLLEELESPILILNRIYDSENIGSILRTARAFGINSCIYDRESSHPYLRRSVRVSMGNIFGIKFYEAPNIKETFPQLKNLGLQILGASAIEDFMKPISLYQYSFPDKWALVLGNEANGIPENILTQCNALIHIPMELGVDSLNVSHSLAGILAVWKYHSKI
jgi:tRNA G18 (ribose-2'-O)-methylase SpoU